MAPASRSAERRAFKSPWMSPMATTRALAGRRKEEEARGEGRGARSDGGLLSLSRAAGGAATRGVETVSGFASGVRLQASVPKAPSVRVCRRRTAADERMRASQIAAFFKERPKSRYRWHT